MIDQRNQVGVPEFLPKAILKVGVVSALGETRCGTRQDVSDLDGWVALGVPKSNS